MRCRVKKIIRRILKIIGYSIGGLLLGIILFALFTQTGFFKERLRVILASSISTRLNGTLHLGTITGNFLAGFSIDSIAIYNEQDVFLTSRKITCQYDPFPLLKKKLQMNYLIIEQPTIHLARSSNGEWNLIQLIKQPEDTASGKFDWTLIFDDFELKNATINLVDSASLLAPDHWNMPAAYFEYHNFSINDLNLKLTASIKENDFQIKMDHISCYSPQSQFELSHFKGDFAISEKNITAKNMIIQSGRSYIEIDAIIRDINIFKGINLENLQHDSTHIQFRAKNIDLNELKSFIPQIAFLDGSAFIDLDAGGEFGNLTINHLNVRTLESTFNLSGNLRNLHTPGELFLDILIGDSKFNAADAAKLLTGLDLPKFEDFGNVSFFAEFVGKPVNFKSKASLKGLSGRIEIDGALNLEEIPPSYNFIFNTNNLALGKIFDAKNFQSSLSAKGSINGKGFSLKDLSSKIDLTIDSSFIQNIYLNHSNITATASPYYLDMTASLNSNEMKASVQSQIEFSDSSIKSINGNLELASFDLAVLLDDSQYQSDINLQGKFSGSGHTIDNLNANLDLSLFPSTFRNHDVTPGNIFIVLDQKDKNEKNLSIESPLADLSLTGKFKLDKTLNMFAHQTDNLIETIKKHAAPESSTSIKERPRRGTHHQISSLQKTDFLYTLKIKDLDPISSIIGGTPFNAQAVLEGYVHVRENNLSLTCDGTIDEFYFGTTKGGILLRGGNISLKLDSLSDVNTLEQLLGKLDLSIDSGLLNTRKLEDIKLGLNYQKISSNLKGHCIIDSLYEIIISGNVSVQPHTYAFDFDSLIVSLGDFSWRNDQDVQLRLNNDGLRIMHGTIKRDLESFSIKGALHPNGEIDLTSILRKFDLATLGVWLRNEQLSQTGQGFTGQADLDLHVTGSMQSPVITLRSMLDNTYFRQTHIGQVTTVIDYENQIATIDMIVKEKITVINPSLTLKGTLPIDLAISNVDERFPDQQQRLQLTSDGFNLSVLDPIIKDVDNLSGILRCNVTMTGTPREPNYQGTIQTSDTRFLFIPNNITYILDGELEPHEDQIHLKKIYIKNISDKKLSGEAYFTGSLSIRNFLIASFDIAVHGKLLLLTEASRKSNPNMYGTLFTEISPEGLKLQGTLDHPYLSGILYINEANLIFPPTKKMEAANSNLTLKHKIIDDTTKNTPVIQKLSKFYTEHDSIYLKEEDQQSYESPLLERLRYNLGIETQGLTALTMIFTPATGEELYAELDGKVNAINDQGTPNIYGEIEISPRSYYNFFKRFDATGKLKFVGRWDNPELDIHATHEGYRQAPQELADETKSLAQTNIPSTQQTTEQKVIVELKIGGTRFEPKLTMAMKVQLKPGEEPIDWSTQTKGGDVQSDAIAFIITGKFRDQLTRKEQQEFTDLGSAAGTSVASSLLSSIFSDVLKKEFPFILRTEVSYRGGSIQEGTSLNVSATAFKGHLRVGGKILNDIGNTNVSYQLSLGDFLNYLKLRNLYLEIQRKVEGANPEDKKLTNEARIFYRFSF